MDELSPLFHDIEFNERFRGYDVEEVDAYVDRVAKAAALVQGRIAELQDRVATAEAQPRTVVAPAAPASTGGELDDARLSRVLVLAQRTADAAIEEAKAEAEMMRDEAGADAERIRREADDHASLVLAEAETDRRRLITEAEEAAAGAVAAERARVAAEVAELERHRAFLSDDIAILEQHLAETRLSVAASLSALTDLLETPEAFRAPAMPATSGVEVPAGLIEGRGAAVAPVVEEPTAATPTDPVVVESEPDAAETADTAEILDPEAAPAVSTPDLIDPDPAEVPSAEADPIVFDPQIPAAEGTITFDPSEPTQTFETVPVAPQAERTSADGSLGESETHAETPAETVATADEEAEADADELEPVAEALDQSRVFDIDLLDDEPEAPVVDLTEPVVDLAEPSGPEAEGHTPALDTAPASDRSDGDAATATAPPRLITAEDIETADVAEPTAAGEWIDELRDAAGDTEPTTEPSDLLFAPPETPANDHFLDQLRDAVGTDESEEFAEDALAAFFDDGEDGDGRGWFNRRR